ncbi:cation:proton antiporter [Streptomyces olivoreticuli]
MEGSSLGATVLADIAVVLLIGVALTPLRTRLRQPVVVGEIAAGVLLGPSVLGLLPGDLPGMIFPSEMRVHLSVVAQVGIVLFMFVAGWELDFHILRGRVHSVLAVTVTSLAVPFLLAMVLALVILARHPDLVRPGNSPLLFILFMGVVLSVSALSVLVRIVGENRLQATTAGAMATACGALTEVVAWCAVVCLITTARGSGAGHLLLSLARIAAYALVMALAVRPALRGLLHCREPQRVKPLLLILVISSGVFLSAWFTSQLGIHAVIGAFAFGLVMPRDLDPALRHTLETPLQHTGVLLVPVFFALTGLSVDLGALGWSGALELTAFLGVAWGGKFAGAALTARLLGQPWRQASTLGVLLNTKGLSEVLMLTLGREAGLIDAHLFTVLLLTALAATATVNPLVRRLAPQPDGEGARTPIPVQHEQRPVVEASDEHRT